MARATVICAYCGERQTSGPYDRCGLCRTYRDEEFCEQRGIEHGNVESFLDWCDRTHTDVLSTFDITDEEWLAIRRAAYSPIKRLRETFQSPYEQHADRVGQSFELLRELWEPDASHDAEVLPMYVIRFPDGTEIEAWPEEINADEIWQPSPGPARTGAR